jgi:Tfp pilus assembly protein PilF
MEPLSRTGGLTKEEVWQRIRTAKKDNRWDAIAEVVSELSDGLPVEWLPIVDEVAFALGQLRRWGEAIALLECAYKLEPTHRRASSLAYLHYDALMNAREKPEKGKPERPPRDREADRRGFERWIQEALRLRPNAVKDLYRLGVYESQIQTCRDKAALRAFQAAVAAYRALSPEERSAHHHWFKPYVKSLYCGARSAMRLGRAREAQKLIFDCIREDKATDHTDPLYKFFLAGRVCMELGQLDHAERAFRLALDAAGTLRRDFVFGGLALVALRQNRLDDAAGWIERHVPAHRRAPYLWRLLGDIRRAAGDREGARAAYQNALQHDRAGRHLTYNRLGDLEREAGRLREARAAYEKAAEFRQRRYLSEDREALHGLEAILETTGDSAALARVRDRLRVLEGGRQAEEGRT